MSTMFFNQIWPLHRCHGSLKHDALGGSPASYLRLEKIPPSPRGTQMKDSVEHSVPLIKEIFTY